MACPDHACDCLRPPEAAAPGETVEVWSKREHVQARLQQLCGEQRPRWTDGWAARLETTLGAMTPTERSAVRVTFADGDVLDGVTALERGRTAWLPGLLAGGDLHMVFQAVVDLSTGAAHGREALVRGTVDGQELSGGQIVSASQAHDALAQMDVRARTLAIETAARVLPAGETLFVNFNPTTIYDPEACLRITWAAARRAGLPLSRICFEVVETERYPDLAFLERILDRYREEGALVALDDLGAGHASLDYLRRLRPDVVKLDRSLSSLLGDDEPRVRLVAALVDYAHDLDIAVVAEGLETADDVAMARGLGADFGQGWWFGRPAREIAAVDPQLVNGRSSVTHAA